MSSRRRAHLVLLVVLGLAAALRLQNLDWDGGRHLHPDERFLTMVTEKLAAPADVATYFDTARSPLNPANQGYRFFVYGTLPLFVTRATAAALGRTGYDELPAVGRVLSALWDLGTVLLTWRLGLLLAGPALGLAAAALVAVSVTSIQHAHFFTVDAASGFFAAAALLALLHVARDGRRRCHLAFGVALGLACACRVNLVLLALPYGLALLVAWRAGAARAPALAGGAVLAALVAAVCFRVANPYAFAGPGFFGLAPAEDFVRSLREIRGYLDGTAEFPPSLQWIARPPVLFAARNVLGWGLGPAWGVAAVAGALWAVARWWRLGAPGAPGAIVAVWTAGVFLFQAAQFAPTMRYFLPLVPGLALLAAWPLVAGGRARRALLAALLVATTLWALAFTAIYRRPHTRVEASRWLHREVPAGAVVAGEHWDDLLPLSLPGAPASRYALLELPVFADDDAAKRTALVDGLDRADWLVLSSNRAWGTVPRLPWRYPMGRRYYELLFSGALGLELERVFTSYPRLGPLEIPDDGAEEAFSVYDHPTVLVFRKTPRWSRAEAERLLAAVPLDGVVRLAPADASRRFRGQVPPGVALPGGDAVRTALPPDAPGSLAALARWLVAFEALWLAVAVLLFPWLRALPDGGVGLAALVAWLGPGWLAWLATSLGVPIVDATGARLVAAPIVVAALAVGTRQRAALRVAPRRPLVLAQLVFLGSVAVFAGIRALAPAIHWGEKPMDFAILNAILRAQALPPPDPWFAGGTLNYAYVGHAMVAYFARLGGVPAPLAFNLGVVMQGGLLAVAAFTAGRLLGGRVLAGVLALLGVAVLGNLAGVRLLAVEPGRALDFHWFWATSRVIPHTINEFPFWSLVFADLHAHVMAQPLLVGIVAAGAGALALRGTGAVAGALLGGFVAGALAATNPWSLPTAVATSAIFVLVWWRRHGRTAAAAGVTAAAALVAGLAFAPFWAAYRSPGGGAIGVETQAAPLGDVLTVVGLLLAAVVPPLAVQAWGRFGGAGRVIVAGIALAGLGAAALARGPASALYAGVVLVALAAWRRDDGAGRQAATLLVALAGAIGVATETVYVWDRMNTVFKYGLDAWLLLACAAPVLVLGAARWPRAWRLAYAGSLAALAVGGAWTSLGGAIGFVRAPMAASDAPTLDGWDHLRTARPDELAAYRWLQANVPGVPVMLEAQGPSYGEFTRVAMHTGLPTLVGWDYHLRQQGRAAPQLARRRADVDAFYTTTDRARAAAILDRYHVDLVFVGPLERRTYPAAGLAKLEDWDRLTAVFRRGDVVVYARPDLLARHKTWIEPVAEAAPDAPAPLGELREPRDVARTPDGDLAVADFGHGRVQRLAADGSPGTAIGRRGAAPGEFRDPCGIAVAPDGRIVVADTWNHRIQVLAPDGTPLAAWQAELYGPRGVALGADGTVYVTDTGHRRVVRFAPDGRVRGSFGQDVLGGPIGVAVAANGDVLVTDPTKQQIVVFASDGTPRATWPVPFAGGDRIEPYLDVGPDGVVWVTDPGANAVRLFAPDGTPLGTATADGPLARPLGIAVLDAHTAVVTNAGDDRLVRVRRPAAATP